MNSKFFDVNKDKQDGIINAALKLFAQKGYKDASTDVIVKQAGISKGLLFHYFISKQGLYEFIVNYSTKYMILELTRSVKNTEKDYFAIMSQIEMGKTRVARNYPYMQMFLRSLQFEKDPDAISAIGDSIDELKSAYKNIYMQINPKEFINPEDYETVTKLIEWINDGFMREELHAGTSCDEAYDKFSGILSVLRKHFYKSDNNATLSIAKEELYERNETVMDDLKMEATFEERLLAGKRPLVDLPVEEKSETEEADEKAEDNKEQDAVESESVKEPESASDTDNAETVKPETDVEESSVEEAKADAAEVQAESEDAEDEFFDEEDSDEELEGEYEDSSNGISEDDVVIAPTHIPGRFDPAAANSVNSVDANSGLNMPVYRSYLSE